MMTSSRQSETTEASTLALVRMLRWSAQSPVKLFVLCFGVLAAVLVVVGLKALAWGLRFHLLPDYWSGVYQRHPIAIPLIFAGASLCISIIGAALVFVLRRKGFRRTEQFRDNEL